MFAKELRQNLALYLRRQWPYALALVLASVFGYILVLVDNNPIESWGIVLAIPLFAMASLAYIVQIFVSSVKTFRKRFLPNDNSVGQAVHTLLWSQILAFMIAIYVSAVVFFACVSISAWKIIGETFASFADNWTYIFEFLLYITIVSLTTYIMLISDITVFRFNGKRRLSLALSIVSLVLCCGLSVTVEVLLLIHSPSTDMPKVWATVIVLLVVFVLADIIAYAMTWRAVKSSYDNQSENHKI